MIPTDTIAKIMFALLEKFVLPVPPDAIKVTGTST
jgi:hypothetical protein